MIMKKTEKRTEANAPKRTYSKPQIEKVQLVPEEAVLANCKQTVGEIQVGPGDSLQCQPNENITCLNIGS
jgi:hypothetical protein